MRLRRWIGWLAIAGMLMHAVALVRHNVSVLDSAIAGAASSETARAYSVLNDDGTVLIAGTICHTDGDQDAGSPGGQPKSGSERCPVCAGTVAAVALAAPEPATISRPLVIAEAVVIATAIQTPAQHFVRPPNRGPPAAI